MVLSNLPLSFRKSARLRAIVSVRGRRETLRSKSLVVYSASGIGRSQTVKLASVRPPAYRIRTCDDAMDAIRREETVFNALPQGVGVERIAKIEIRVAIIFALWGGGHAELKSRFEILEDILPIGFVGCAATVALVHDYQVKEILWVIAVKTGAVLVCGNRLIGREIDRRLLMASPSILCRASPNGAKVLSFGSSTRMLRSAR